MQTSRWNKQNLIQALGSITEAEQEVSTFFATKFDWDLKTEQQKIESDVNKSAPDEEITNSNYLSNLDKLIDFATNTVVIDSRQIIGNENKGCIFLALPGNNFDGSDFAVNALANGASICLVEKIPSNLPHKYQNRIAVVPNSHLALIKMAIYARNNSNANVICITGSCGKTTTKEMIRIALEEIAHSDYIHTTIGNYNNHYGLPLTLANLPPETKYAVLELGMNGSGEISVLSKIARPQIAIITGIYNAHREYFADIKGIANAKAEICDGLISGTLIVNADIDRECYDIVFQKATEMNARIITYGSIKTEKNLDIIVDKTNSTLITSEKTQNTIQNSKQLDKNIKNYCERTEITANTSNNKQYHYHLPSIGHHLVLNSLAIIGVGLALANSGSINSTLDCEDYIPKLLQGLQNFTPPNGRGNIYFGRNNGVVIIDESYNANPDSMKAAIRRAHQYRQLYRNQRLLLILGDMKELGANAKKMHLDLKDVIISSQVDIIHTVGEISKELYKTLQQKIKGSATYSSAEMVAQIAKPNSSIVQQGDVILVKGSNSMGLKSVVKILYEMF